MNRSITVIIAVLLCVASVIFQDIKSIANASENCDAVQVIYARGSGQEPGEEDEFERLRAQLTERLADTKLGIYELGDTPHDGYQYEAVGIGMEDLDNATGAFFSAGMANDYGRSVDSGVNELKAYLGRLHDNCPATKIVLGGYSQGAQVIGQSLGQLASEIRNNITFVALFGDPKLFLPEGAATSGDIFDLPPACKDSRVVSLWRRDIDNCLIAHGSLGPRLPYLPGDMEQKVGAWCVGGDWICGGLENVNLNSSSAHSEDYPKQDGPIDQAAYEIALRLHLDGLIANILPDPSDSLAAPPAVIFMLDNSTLSDANHFLAVDQPLMINVAGKIIGAGGHVGIKVYGVRNTTDPCVYMKSTATLSVQFFADMDYLLQRPSCSNPTSQSLKDAIVEMRGESAVWRHLPENTRKVFLVFSNQHYSSAQLASYRLISQVQDEIAIYPFTPSSVRSSYSDLHVSGGEVVILDELDTGAVMSKHTLYPQVKPTFDSLDYKALPGQTIAFSAEKSKVYDDKIVEYQWNFGDGGSYVGNQPTVEHAYATVFKGSATLTVTTESGLQESTSATVTVQEHEAFLPSVSAPDNLQVVATSSTTVQLNWDDDELAEKWLVTLDGIPLGNTSDNFVTITDLEHWRDNVFGVYGVLADGQVGEKAEVVLGAYAVSAGDSLPQGQQSKVASGNTIPRYSSGLFTSTSNNGQSRNDSAVFDAPSLAMTYGSPSADYIKVLLGILGASAVLIGSWMAVHKLKRR